jgi:hypothetical protein
MDRGLQIEGRVTPPGVVHVIRRVRTRGLQIGNHPLRNTGLGLAVVITSQTRRRS